MSVISAYCVDHWDPSKDSGVCSKCLCPLSHYPLRYLTDHVQCFFVYSAKIFFLGCIIFHYIKTPCLLLLDKLSFPVSINTRSHSFSKAFECIYFYTNAFLKHLSLCTTLHQFIALLTYKIVFVILENIIYTLVPYLRYPAWNTHKRNLTKLKP